jgi:PPOX class probable F420-dependent enzyme
MGDLSQQEISDFLSEPRVAHLATVRPDGRPHLAPIWYMEEDGKAYVITGPNAVRTRNVRQNPTVSLSIATDQRPFKYVILEGEGRLSKDNVNQVTERICVRCQGPEEGLTYARRIIEKGIAQVLEVKIQRVISWDGTGSDGRER